MKESLLILAAALAMVSCGGNAQQKAATAGTQQTTAAAPDMHNAETSLDYLRVYKDSDSGSAYHSIQKEGDSSDDRSWNRLDQHGQLPDKGTDNGKHCCPCNNAHAIYLCHCHNSDILTVSRCRDGTDQTGKHR